MVTTLQGANVATNTAIPRRRPCGAGTASRAVGIARGNTVGTYTGRQVDHSQYPGAAARIVISNPEVLETTTISASQVVVTAKLQGAAALSCGMKLQRPHCGCLLGCRCLGTAGYVRSAYPGQAVRIEAEQGKVVASDEVNSKEIADGVLRMAGLYSKNVVDSLIDRANPRKADHA